MKVYNSVNWRTVNHKNNCGWKEPNFGWSWECDWLLESSVKEYAKSRLRKCASIKYVGVKWIWLRLRWAFEAKTPSLSSTWQFFIEPVLTS